MKALLASALTALVLVSAAWASNVTPAQLSTLSKRVAALQSRVNSLQANLEANDSAVGGVQTRETKLATKVANNATDVGQLAAAVASDEAYVNRCLSSFEPASTYSVTFTNDDGSLTTFDDYEVPGTGVAPDFWLPAVPSTCVSSAGRRAG